MSNTTLLICDGCKRPVSLRKGDGIWYINSTHRGLKDDFDMDCIIRKYCSKCAKEIVKLLEIKK